MHPAITIAILVIIVAGGVWLSIFLLLRRKRRGAYRNAKSIKVNAKWWREQEEKPGELLYLALGDSSAQGVGASQPHNGYVGTIAAHLRRTTGRSVRVVNLSVSGARLREALATQVPQLAGSTPDIVTVEIGANDIRSFNHARFVKEFNELLAALPPGTIVGEVPCFFLGTAEKNVRLANAIIHRAAREHGFPIAPLYAATKRQGAARVALNQSSADFFHPNDRGYRVWAGAFLPLVDRAVRELAKVGDPA